MPDTETYTVVVNPGVLTVSLTLTLSEPITGTLAIGGLSVPIAISRPGQDTRLIFGGTAGQRVNLGASGVSFGPGGVGLEMSILNPDGTRLASTLVGTNGVGTEPLPTTGSYTVVVDPSGATTASLTLTLSEPVTGTLTFGGPSVPVALSRPGQDARLTFDGTAGQRVNLEVREVSFGGAVSGSVFVSILNPDSTQQFATSLDETGGDIKPAPLPANGTYAVVIDPLEGKLSR